MNIPKSQIQPNTLDPEMMNLVPGRRSDMFGGSAVILAIEELKDDAPLDVNGNRADIIFEQHNSADSYLPEKNYYMQAVMRVTGILPATYEDIAELLTERKSSFLHMEGQLAEIENDSSDPLTREESITKTLTSLAGICARVPITYADYKLQRDHHANNMRRMAENVILVLDTAVGQKG